MNKLPLMKGIFLLLFFISALQAVTIEDASGYYNNSRVQWDIAMKAIDLKPWKGSERVLDIGCGDGKITAYLAKKLVNGSILGIDLSEPMIDFATSLYPQTEYPNLSFQAKSATDCDFENQFDRVVSFSAMHWIMDQKKALEMVHRALAPGGAACLQVFGPSAMNLATIGNRLIHTEKWAPYFPSHADHRIFFTEEAYRTLLEEVGFDQITISSSCEDTPFSNRQDLLGFVTPVLNFIRHLPQDLQSEFAEEVVDQIIPLSGISDDKMIHFRTFSLHVVAIK